jgi:hypothetical protein
VTLKPDYYKLNKYSVETLIDRQGDYMLKIVFQSLKRAMIWLQVLAESLGRARAAAHLSRMGLHDAARKVMTEN